MDKFRMELRPYQKKGTEFLIGNMGALLADDMGLGKTVQVIRAIQKILDQDPSHRCLIVSPAVLKHQWKHEFNKWAPDVMVEVMPKDRNERVRSFYLPYPVTITSYEQVRSDRHEMTKIPYSLVVLDEAQKIKNPSSALNQAIFELKRNQAWIITATPVENSLRDVVTLTNFLEFGMLNEAMSPMTVSGLLQPIMLRRTKEEVAPELPPIIDQTVSLVMEGEQATRYFNTEMEHHDNRQALHDFGHILAAITELKQICNFDDESKESIKLQALENILENASEKNQQVIIASQYVETLRFLLDHSQFSEYMEMYHGNMSDAAKVSTLQRFNSKEDFGVLLLSMRSGAYGLNIPNADYVVLFDRWWNPAVETQTINRAHRIGRMRPLQAIRFRTVDTIEDRIVSLLQTKSNLQSTILNSDLINLEEHITLDEMKSLLLPTAQYSV
jgi:SNF2 family DNA or RNA helicase